MIRTVFLSGLLIFAVASAYFLFTSRSRGGLNAAFLISFVTLISYVVMWQGDLTVVTRAGQPIFWTRWPFYILSCTLLMVEIGQVKGIGGGRLVQILWLTGLVMLAGTLAARDLSDIRWVYYALSSVAYILLVIRILPSPTAGSRWINPYIYFGWTVFPLVFILAPTGLAVIGAALANLLYLLLDIYTKIIFNIQIESYSRHQAR
ncbi:MAG: bacteriorhodopsin [Anaerolineae bacterium]